MSRFLKFIVHLIIIVTILDVVAMAVPPFFGIHTIIIDNSYENTNLALGSVTYAKEVGEEELKAGDEVLVQDTASIYSCTVTSVSQEEHSFTVDNTQTGEDEEKVISLKVDAPKVIVTIPVIGYLLVATQSVEGLIVLALAVLFLIILFIIAELWKRDPDEEEEDYEEDEAGHEVKSRKQLRKEEKARARQLREEDKALKAEDKKHRKEEKKRRKKVKTGGFIDEVYEEDLHLDQAPVQSLEEEPVRPTEQVAASEAHEVLRKEIAAATAEEETVAGVEEVTESNAVENEKTVQEPEEALEEAVAENMEIKKLAIPLYTAEELASKAKAAGDDPYVDEVAGVTLFDYSDIIGGNPEEE